jgi:PKD repeat protein
VWDINNEESAFYGNPMENAFHEAEAQTVTMNITSESGCTYFKTKTFDIVPAPEALFSVSSDIGSPPFPVDFTNRSANASAFQWNFGDGAVSQEQSTAHVFAEDGEYAVTLEASNDQGCTDTFTKKIVITPSFPDISVLAITTTKNPDKTLKVVITLENQGNTILNDLPVDIDVSGTIDLRELVKGPVMPHARFNLTLGYALKADDRITFLCAEAMLKEDRVPLSNRTCIQFGDEVVIRPGYPNPVQQHLTVEWIATTEQNVTVSLFNSLGNKMWSHDFMSQKGLNQKIFDVESLQTGIYMLILEAGNIKTRQRLLLTK